MYITAEVNDIFKRLKDVTFENMLAAVAQKYPKFRPTTQLMTEPDSTL